MKDYLSFRDELTIEVKAASLAISMWPDMFNELDEKLFPSPSLMEEYVRTQVSPDKKRRSSSIPVS